ncbi:polymorphic toxin-type HINT domain-containing protein, partial [Streptomyces sp. SP17BM10]|uniref:polymorphic toxin-type HINT domain-containing protein n=1 Tax=Streptomyces sp. SP17BM10 TaxID=3002530 RepID=UPI002E7993E1
DDNRVLVTQALATGGAEVKAAAQAVLSGPADRLVPFLQTGLPKAQQRDAVTAAHVATIASYLATIDGSVAQAKQYAAQAAQSYQTALGAATEAAKYAGQAAQSAQDAQGFAAQAAQSAQQAQASAAQAAKSAQQAQASAASADAAARSASYSAIAATSYANQAQQFASAAKTASDQAQASAAAANKSKDEAQKAADEAKAAVFTKQQADSVDGKLQDQTVQVDSSGRVSYIEAVPQGDMKTEQGKDNLGRCTAGDFVMGHGDIMIKNVDPKVWHDNGKGTDVCDVTVHVKVTGTVDYVMKTCPEPGLSIAACAGKYTVWNTVLVSSTQVNDQRDETFQLSYFDYRLHYSPEAVRGQILWHALTDDFVKCYHDPGLNSSCAWAAATFIPYEKLAAGAKSVVAFRFALVSGVGIDEAKLAVQAALDGYSQAAISKLTATADAVGKFRQLLKDGGAGADAALEALKQDQNIDRGLFQQLQNEEKAANDLRKACPTKPNSFPAGTPVLMGDGTRRPIEQVRVGDTVLATDPATGATTAQRVETTIYTPDDDEFTELTIAAPDGSTGALTSTSHHRFWVESTHVWREAGDLVAGDSVRTSDGQTARITGTRHWTGVQPTYNLSVTLVHTYYVLAGNTPVLVHNGGEAGPGEIYLWRAVTAPELADISANRTWNSPQGVKYFSFTEAGAAEYARRAYAAYPAEGPYTMIRTKVTFADLPEGTRMTYTADVVDGGVALNNDELKLLGRPSIMTGMSTGIGCP